MAKLAGFLLFAFLFSPTVSEAPASEWQCTSDNCDNQEPEGLSLIQRSATVTKTKGATATLDGKHAMETSQEVHTEQKAKAKSAVKGSPFFSLSSLNYPQLIFVTIIYGYILYVGSNMIGDGSEQLQFFPSVAGMVGSTVVPILGAVPDGMMVLVSGLGPNAQTSVTTGVGALAGSTVMLVTFPWFIAVVCGSVPIGSNGEADYKRASESGGLFSSGVTFGPEIGTNAKIMLLTSLIFLIIQIPAAIDDHKGVSTAEQAADVSIYALIGLIVSIIAFFGYCFFMYLQTTVDQKVEFLIDQIKQKNVSISAVLENYDTADLKEALPKLLRCFFFEYDTDGSGNLDLNEFSHVLRDLGEPVSKPQVQALFDAVDTSGDKEISFSEFCTCIEDYVNNTDKKSKLKQLPQAVRTMPAYDIEDEEEEEVPEDLADLSPEAQTRVVLGRAFWGMGVGTALVLGFSDAAVNTFTEWGDRLGISSFYVGFLLAPFASNASELLVAYGYAVKKSKKSITTSLSSLVGAACMNNTFCLAVFFALVYFKKLAWQFKAETTAIIAVQWFMGVVILTSNTERKFMAYVILSLYPISLIIVWFLETICGWD